MITNIPDATIKAYAAKHKLTPMAAYRDLLSQVMLDKIDLDDVAGLKEVVRELVKQTVGSGTKDKVNG